MDNFFFPATTGTHADVFAAVGLASLVRSAGDCTIRQAGPGFEVILDVPSTLGGGSGLDYSPGYLFLKPNAESSVPTDVGEVLDYVVEKAKVDANREARKAARAAGAEIAEEVDANKPRKDWRLYQVLNALQGDDAANNIVKAIRKLSPAEWREQLHQALRALRANEVAKVPWDTSLVQLFSPHAAKGYARLKPDGTGRNDKTKDAWPTLLPNGSASVVTSLRLAHSSSDPKASTFGSLPQFQRTSTPAL
jgi:hypothetical protein